MGVRNKRYCRVWGIFRRLGLVTLLTLSIAACQKSPDKSAGPPEKLTIAYATFPQTALVHIAFTKGFFSAEGLDVTAQPHEFGRQALNSVLEGKADLATPADTPIMFAVTGGKKICTLAIIATSNENLAVVARKDGGITVPADLRGKQIGVTLGTTGEFFLDSFLSTRGISRKEVTIIDLEPSEMPDALNRKRVDAVSTWNPTLKLLQRSLGDSGVVFYDETIYSDTFCLAAGKEFAENHPETVKKVLRALIRAESFAKQNPEESRNLVAEFIKTEKAIVDEMWNSFDFRVTLDQSLVVSLEDQTRWAQRLNLTTCKEMPNYLEFIYFSGLQSVKSEAVRIIR